MREGERPQPPIRGFSPVSHRGWTSFARRLQRTKKRDSCVMKKELEGYGQKLRFYKEKEKERARKRESMRKLESECM